MGFFDDYNEEEVRPRRKSRRGSADDSADDRLDWRDLGEGIDEPEEPTEEPDEESEEDEDTIQELEIDDHGRMRRSSRDEIDPDFWNEDE
jgi:hypothetical protein